MNKMEGFTPLKLPPHYDDSFPEKNLQKNETNKDKIPIGRDAYSHLRYPRYPV